MQPSRIRTGISSACFFPMETLSAVKLLTQWKVSNIEVFFNTQSELEYDYVSRIMELCDKAGTHIASVHPFTSAIESLFFFSPYEGRLPDAIEYYRKYLRAAKQMGAKILVFHGDSPKNSGIPLEQGFQHFKMLDQISQEEFGIRTAYENVSWCRGREPEYFVKLREYYPEACFVLDTKQALRSGRHADQYLDTIGKNITHVHISDSCMERNENCLPIGTGNMDVKGFLNRLLDQGFEGCVLEEVYRDSFKEPEELLASYQKLNEIVASL